MALFMGWRSPLGTMKKCPHCGADLILRIVSQDGQKRKLYGCADCKGTYELQTFKDEERWLCTGGGNETR